MDSVKYIGMDVHKEAISVAVLNFSGKLVMECTIETKAITILDFLKGLRGSLHVTFEEGPWAAWLYDLIKPHVAELVVCNPRRNALLKEGSKSDRIDARKLAELLHSTLVCSVYHGENGVRTLRELAELSDDQHGSDTGDDAREGDLPQLGDSLQRKTGLRRTLSRGVAGQDPRSRGAPPGGVLLPAIRCVAGTAPGSAAPVARRSSEARRLEIVTRDSVHRPDPGGSADRFDSNTASFPYQATALDLQRIWDRNAQQCRTTFRPGRTAAREETGLGSWTESQPQSRSEEPVQECRQGMGHESPMEPWLAPGNRAALLVSERTGFVVQRR